MKPPELFGIRTKSVDDWSEFKTERENWKQFLLERTRLLKKKRALEYVLHGFASTPDEEVESVQAAEDQGLDISTKPSPEFLLKIKEDATKVMVQLARDNLISAEMAKNYRSRSQTPRRGEYALRFRDDWGWGDYERAVVRF